MASSHKTPRRKLGTFKRLADGTIRVTVRSGHRLDGGERSATGYAESEDEAERVALELAAQLSMRPDLGRGLTLLRWWQAYSVGKGARLTRATFSRYEQDMEGIWLPALGDRDISLISRAEVQDVLLTLDTRSKASHAKAALSAVISQAVTDGYLTENPIRKGGFELPGDVGTEDDAWADFDDDPFGTLEGTSDVWDAITVLRAMPLIFGCQFEGAWLAMVGAGLRMEEAFALRWKDVRRIQIGGLMVTQLAVHAAETVADGRKRTKTKRSRRIAAMVEPFGERMWELRGDPDGKVSPSSLNNINRQWRRMWEPLDSKHVPKSGMKTRGRMVVDPPIPYVPLSHMRATHETYMQQAGVLDSVNAAAHGHSERISYKHYQHADGVAAAQQASAFLLVEGGRQVLDA